MPGAVSATTHRFTVEEYHRMAEAGILNEDDRVELIEGEIVDLAPIGRKHQACVDRLTGRFSRGLGERVSVCREPGAEGYQLVLEVRGEAELRPQAFPDLVLTADGVLGRIA